MPHFAIHCIDKPNSGDLRAKTRPSHLEHIAGIRDRIVAAGPLLDADGGPIGSLIIAEFDGRTDAVGFAASDPYARAGLFASVAVTAWRQVYPDPA
jgi:hypothetical protein|tara:strand:- start:30665 stop:30952 length:288 start_codon:yes stop_codon:yes gene_type:complete